MSNSISKKFSFSDDWQILIWTNIVNLIVSTFISSWDPLMLERYIDGESGIYGVYVLIFCVLLIALGGWHNALIEKLRRKDFNKYVELGEYMKEGVEIQRTVRKHYKNATEEELKIPIEKLDAWHEKTYQKYKEINPIGAGIWYISETKTQQYADKDYGEISAKYLNILDSRINELKYDLNYFKELIDQQK